MSDTAQTQAVLMLEDGSCWPGVSFGDITAPMRLGELVFNTAMTGYQEILTDPSYRGQVVLMTYPEIGNYGVNEADLESKNIHAAGFVVRRLSPVTSSWRAAETLNGWMQRHGLLGIEGVDTRALTRRIRELGAMKCGITTADLTTPEAQAAFLQEIKAQPSLDDQDLVGEVTTPEVYTLQGQKDSKTDDSPWLLNRLVAVDFGMKANILRCMQTFVKDIIVVPASASYAEIAAYSPDAVFLSNGPGDPRRLTSVVELAQTLMAQGVPTFGICLGHQILSLALGLRVEKMRFGHHGGNHPVKDLELNAITITSQNHGYCVIDENLPPEVSITHVNLNDGSVEGFRHKHLPVAAVQFHPEAAPGPHDAFYLFRRFLEGMIAPNCPQPNKEKALCNSL